MTIEQGYQAFTRIGEYNGEKAVIKMVKHPNIPLLRELEWWMLSREARALKELDTIESVPDFLGYPDDYSFAMVYREGTDLRQKNIDQLPSRFFSKLESAIQKIHEKGIVHADLIKKENVMVTPDGDPVLLDFGSHFRKKRTWHFLNNAVYSQFEKIDRHAVAKLKHTYCSEEMSPEDIRWFEYTTVFQRISRFVRTYILCRK